MSIRTNSSQVLTLDQRRQRTLVEEDVGGGPVVYWMGRDQRVRDNWALLHASEIARTSGVALAVVFTLAPKFLGATLRHYDFMLRGLAQVERDLARLGIPFFLLAGSPADELATFIRRHRVGTLVSDFSPLRIHRKWKDALARKLAIPFFEVDAHNIVPAWIVSNKREFSAATFRPKIHRLLPTFLVEFPVLKRALRPWPASVGRTAWDAVRRRLMVDAKVGPVDDVVPGEENALDVLDRFVAERLSRYGVGRNDPSDPCQSALSPYLHFGQIAPQRVALEVSGLKGHEEQRDAFLEELIVRRELSDNFCLYTPGYDSSEAFPDWAKKTLLAHRGDRRAHTYSHAQLERARTHDPLWNAAQREMVTTGRMHGYMRMYWAKKILEWTPDVEEAMRIAIDLNDRYELDGQDPNGYAGIAWSIGGVHDRAWGERPVFGKIRYMSYDGCRRKFDVGAYIDQVTRAGRSRENLHIA